MNLTTPELFKAIEEKGLRLQLRDWKTTGFHGTSEEFAVNIVKQQHVRPTSQTYGYLGEGAYFWEDSTMTGRQAAISWARNEKRVSEPAVISADIKLDRLLDLGAPENEPFLVEVQNYLVELLKRMAPEELRKVSENDVCKFIAVQWAGAVRIQGFRSRRMAVPGTTCVSQWCLAVCDRACISNIQQVH